MIQIWWSSLEGVMSYDAHELQVDARTHTHGQTDAGNKNN